MSPCGQGRAGTSRGLSLGFAARPPHAGPQRGHSVCCVTCGQATVLSLPQFPQCATEVTGVPAQRLLGAGPRGRGPARVPPPRICCCSWAQACWPWVPLPTSPFLCVMVPHVRASSPDPRTTPGHTVPQKLYSLGIQFHGPQRSLGLSPRQALPWDLNFGMGVEGCISFLSLLKRRITLLGTLPQLAQALPSDRVDLPAWNGLLPLSPHGQVSLSLRGLAQMLPPPGRPP